MKVVLYVLIFVLVTFIYFAYPILRSVKISKEFEAETESFEQTTEIGNMNILVIGDSTAVGMGTTNSRFSTAGRIGEKYPDANLTNISKSGLKLEGLLEKINEIPKDKKYNIIFIQIGANDVVGFTSLKKVSSQLLETLSWAETHGDKTIVVTSGNIGLSPIFRYPISDILSSRTRAVRKIFIEEIEKYKSVKYVDLYQKKETDIFSSDIDKYYARDKFHPSDDGYGIWFDEMVEKN